MLGTDKEPGIYVRTLEDLFRAIEETSDDMMYSVSMSYLEVGPMALLISWQAKKLKAKGKKTASQYFSSRSVSSK